MATAAVAAALFQSVANAEVDAQAAEAKAKQHGCLTCHAVDKQKVGPAYKAVSAKYKGKDVAELSGDMKKLPVHQDVLKKTDDADLNVIFQWILTL
jgi:cytochrome c